MTLWLSHRERVRERTSAYQGALYRLQLDAVVKLCQAYSEAGVAFSALETAIVQDDKEAIQHFSGICSDQFESVFKVVGTAMPLLPNHAMSAVMRLMASWKQLPSSEVFCDWAISHRPLRNTVNPPANMFYHADNLNTGYDNSVS